MKIAVAGCGPAGMAAALLLTRDGHGVTVFERFDAPQPVGSGLIRASRMVGVLPLGGGKAAFFCSLRVDALSGWHAAGLAAWKTEVQALWPETAPLLEQVTHADQMVFARYAHRTAPRHGEPGLIHLGDAWHSASPQLGQGANMALLDAFADWKSGS